MNSKLRIQNEKMKIAVFLFFALCFLNVTFAGSASAMLTATANHDDIKIDFFYHGSSVSVKGEADAGTDLVIKIASPDGTQMLKQKGKVAGLLWMNVGKLEFEDTPNLYSVHSTKPIDEILSPAERERVVIGFPALLKHVRISPVKDESEKERWFNEYVKYKESQKLYASTAGTIETTTDGQRQKYYIMTDWPYQAAPGAYTVTVYAVKGGRVVEQAEAKVHVEQVGLVKSLATMAQSNAAVYGFLSVGIALGAGFGVGMVFRKGGGAH